LVLGMNRFVERVHRSQGLLLPDRLGDHVDDDNPVRVVDAFVEALDLGALGFEAATALAGAGLPITRLLCSRSSSSVTSFASSPPGAWSEKRSGTSS